MNRSHSRLSNWIDFGADRGRFPAETYKYVWADLNGELDSGTWWSGADRPVLLAQQKLGQQPELLASPGGLADHLAIVRVEATHVPEETGETTMMNPFTGEPLERDPNTVGVVRPAFWVVYCSFKCSWESEHGLGVTWRNRRLIGIGFDDGPCVDKNYVPD